MRHSLPRALRQSVTGRGRISGYSVHADETRATIVSGGLSLDTAK